MEPNNFAHYFFTLAIDSLIELGADHFFLAPGSRSSPIVSAIARNHRAKRFLGIDERCVAFSALGYGKRAKKAGVVVTTSGTAVANLYPAIVEAYMSSVPMLVITADRPFELRECGANQTIFQPSIFVNHVVKSFDMAPVSPLISLDALLAIFEQGLRDTAGEKKGPVHINIQLREPLANLPDAREASWSKQGVKKRVMPTGVRQTVRPHQAIIDQFKGNGLIVVGELLPDHGQEQILTLAARLGWPIFADVASNLCLGNHESVIKHYDVKLLNADFLKSIDNFDTVVKFGSRIVSKRFWQWVQDRPSSTTLIDFAETAHRIDQTGRFVHVKVLDVPMFLLAVLDEMVDRAPSTKVFGVAIDYAIAEFLEQSHSNEAYFAARLVERISTPANLFLASSMPIRDVDQFARGHGGVIDVFVNRGASGIDGIMSTAAGIAFADKKPVYVLMGDVAFLHDTNGLMHVKQSSTPMLIVVINNGGGGIFHFLPIAAETDVISPYLDTPHQVRIDLLCRAHNVPHIPIKDACGFDAALNDFARVQKTMVVEVAIDRSVNVLLHQNFYQKIARLRLL